MFSVPAVPTKYDGISSTGVYLFGQGDGGTGIFAYQRASRLTLFLWDAPELCISVLKNRCSDILKIKFDILPLLFSM
jgi:hypothetical protein